jgi:hypothetical protein
MAIAALQTAKAQATRTRWQRVVKDAEQTFDELDVNGNGAPRASLANMVSWAMVVCVTLGL